MVDSIGKAILLNEKENRERLRKISKDRLKGIAEKKIRTTFIGALDSVEKKLGFIWGFDKETHERTDRDKQYYELWLELRDDILNKGNKQLRELCSEIDEYEIVWQKKQIKLIPTGE